MTKPSTLSRAEYKVLAQHPVIKQLLSQSKESKFKDAEFFIPMNSLVNPLSGDSQVNIMVRPTPIHPSEEEQSESTAEELTPGPGKYSRKERKERISVYKAKLERWRNAKKNPKYANWSKIARTKLRIRGRFVKASHLSDDFSDLVRSEETTQAAESSDEQDYNCLVSNL